MSEVLIQMKMPQCCEKCRFFAWKRGVGQHCAVDDRITFNATLDGFDVGYERNGDCPLVSVPPHGRLIDADALLKYEVILPIVGEANAPYLGGVPCVYSSYIKNATTIIEAEEGE